MSVHESIVDADIDTLSSALTSGSLTSVDLVAKYLLRIARYDCRNTALNSIPLINTNVFEEAQAADERRAAGASRGPLDGIPFTVKDAYKVKGMTVASGSEAFEHLVANEDAFVVAALRKAGAVLLGKTNMCPMAYGGMLRGVYGRAESPYNPEYLAAAFGSGSSNGSGVSVGASLAAFGLGAETVSSGRSPASNNALVAYTPSRGLISIRGNWPLYPTCDVVVPHTRTVEDMLVVLDAISSEDEVTEGDFWRDQQFMELPLSTWSLPKLYTTAKEENSLREKRIAVPQMYLEQTEGGPYVSKSIQPLWRQVKSDLEAAGAIVEELPDFPIIKLYEEALSRSGNDTARSLGMPDDWNSVERGVLIAHAWEDFLAENEDPNIVSLVGVDYTKIFPQMSRDNPQLKFTEPTNAVQWAHLASYVQNRAPSAQPGKSSIYNVRGLEAAVKALEAMRKQFFEQWMDKHQFDFVVFPAVGDVARADADVSYASAEHAWANGVKYSHGNRALRHLGIPSVTVPMGILKPQNMPIGLTILGRAYDDVLILKAAFGFEQKTHRRIAPPLLLPLPSDEIPAHQQRRGLRPNLSVSVSAAATEKADKVDVVVEGTVAYPEQSAEQSQVRQTEVDICIDGAHVPGPQIHLSEYTQQDGKLLLKFAFKGLTSRPPAQDARNQVVGKIARDSTMVMVLARNGDEGWPAGSLTLIHQSQL